MSTYGRNRQSIADIELELHDIFQNHPDSQANESGDPVIPANALVDVFRDFGENHNGVQLITDEEEQQLVSLVESNPGLEVTPQILLQFIAMRTTGSPTMQNAEGSDERGRLSNRGERDHSSRSSSHSSGTSHGSASRGPPKTPISSRTPDSPFDNSRRQRSTPLRDPPSSWTAKRPAPAHRRKSDAGAPGLPKRALSDSESTPSSRHGPRSRAPSNPTSPRGTNSQPDLPWNGASPPYIGSPPMRPHSRTQSHGQFSSNSPEYHYGTQGDFNHSFEHGSPPPADHVDSSFGYRSARHGDELADSLSSLTMPRNTSDSDSDSDGEDPTLGLVMDRSAASSMASLAPQDRLDALQRANAELGRKLMDAERTLQNRLSEHESDLEEMQSRLEEAKSELSATKREEKELRAKERQNSNQIAALETEIGKMQKSLDIARASYQSLQKQYQEQCTESEKYRNALRRRDQEIKDHQDQISLHTVEIQKWQQQREQSEAQAANLEGQLAIAREAQAQLDEQKQENLMLKETIDRMRFDMDELRTKADTAGGGGGSSGGASAQGSISKSLGLEIMRMNNGKWIGDEEEEEDVDDDLTAVDEDAEGEETEGEDVIQTIITRKKRKVAGRANKTETIHVEDIKEYSDAYTQHEISEFTTSHTTQTEPEPKRPTLSFSIQTEEPAVDSSAIQTEPETLPTPPETKEIETQTETPEPSRSVSPTPEEEMTSSSSTVRPPTPKPAPHKGELPPAYSQVTRIGGDNGALSDDDDLEARMSRRVAADTLQKWHKGLHMPLVPIAGGVSDEAREEWAALKEELGFECLAIDRVLALSHAGPGPARAGRRVRKGGRFYNIYNTVVYRNGGAAGGEDGGSAGPLVQTVLLALGLSALGIAVLTPYTAPQYAMPGAPTYYDRAAWSSFNTMSASGEGFSPDGTAAVWNFIGRVGGGAARIAAGWPS